MSITNAVFKVHSIIPVLSFNPLPYQVNSQTSLLEKTPRYGLWRHRVARIIHTTLICLGFALIKYRLMWMFFNWKNYTFNHLPQAIIYITIWCFISIHLVFFITIKNNFTGLQDVANDSVILQFKIPNSNKYIEWAKKSLVFPLAFVMVLIPFICTAIPFGITPCPIQLVLGTSLHSKICSSVVFGFMTSYLV